MMRSQLGLAGGRGAGRIARRHCEGWRTARSTAAATAVPPGGAMKSDGAVPSCQVQAHLTDRAWMTLSSPRVTACTVDTSHDAVFVHRSNASRPLLSAVA